MNDCGTGVDFPNHTGLELQKVTEAFASKALPIQAEDRVMGGDGGSGKGNFVKIVVLLGPESRPINVVEAAHISLKFLPEKVPKRPPALGTPTEVTALMANFVVNLPRNDLRFVLVVARHSPDELFRIAV